jgi:hypothetical protein
MAPKPYLPVHYLMKELAMDNVKRMLFEYVIPSTILSFLLIIGILLSCQVAHAEQYSDDEIADAIYLAEGGTKTNHPYGILTKYKITTPRQACINTIRHAKKDWNGSGDFIAFLGSRYCPVGCDNDNGTNKNWIKNVKYFLGRK